MFGCSRNYLRTQRSALPGISWASQICLWHLISFGGFSAFTSSFSWPSSSPAGTPMNACSAAWCCPTELGGLFRSVSPALSVSVSTWIISDDSFPCSWALCSVHSMLMNRNLSHVPLVPFYSLGGVRDGGGGASEDPLFHKAGTPRGPHPWCNGDPDAGSTHALLPPRHLRKFVLYIAWMIIKTSGHELKEAFDC